MPRDQYFFNLPGHADDSRSTEMRLRIFLVLPNSLARGEAPASSPGMSPISFMRELRCSNTSSSARLGSAAKKPLAASMTWKGHFPHAPCRSRPERLGSELDGSDRRLNPRSQPAALPTGVGNAISRRAVRLGKVLFLEHGAAEPNSVKQRPGIQYPHARWQKLVVNVGMPHSISCKGNSWTTRSWKTSSVTSRTRCFTMTNTKASKHSPPSLATTYTGTTDRISLTLQCLNPMVYRAQLSGSSPEPLAVRHFQQVVRIDSCRGVANVGPCWG